MAEIIVMGEMLVEIMRGQENEELYEPGVFRGPFPSGAPAIFIDTAARLGCSTAIIGGVGKDDFGKNILDRLRKDGVDCSHVREHGEVDGSCVRHILFGRLQKIHIPYGEYAGGGGESAS